MTKEKESAIKEVLTRFTSAVKADAYDKNQGRIKEIIEKHGESLLSPEYFHLFVTFPHEEYEEALLRTLLYSEQCASGNAYSQRGIQDIELLFGHYSLVEQNIDKLIEENEGFVCSADKTRFIIQEYLKYAKTEEMPDWESKTTNYWVPNFSSAKNWMEFIPAVINLAYGVPDKYFEVRKGLLAEMKEKTDIIDKARKENFESNPFFVERKENDEGTVYYFESKDDTAHHKGELHVKKNLGHGYILSEVKNGEVRRLRYNDEKPTWFEELMKQL